MTAPIHPDEIAFIRAHRRMTWAIRLTALATLVGTALWLGLFTPFGGLGVWIGLLVGLVFVAALLHWRWSRRASLGLLPA